jgi:hypothetical protein
MSEAEGLQLEDEDLIFLDNHLPAVLDGIQYARDRTIEDKSLRIQELLGIDPSYVLGLERCESLIVRVQKEIDDRGIQRG